MTKVYDFRVKDKTKMYKGFNLYDPDDVTITL